MSTTNKSRWGSLLQQAVAGVEARLDIILAEGEAGSDNSASEATRNGIVPAPAASTQPVVAHVLSTKTNDKLQARLAKAVASSKTSPKPSLFSNAEANQECSTSLPKKTATMSNSQTLQSSMNDNIQQSETTHYEQKSIKISGRDFYTHTVNAEDKIAISSARGDEIKEYVERIDALAAKVKYLSKAASDAARKQIQEADSNQSRQLAERDEKIALLMEEGQALALADQKSRSAVKRLKAQLVEQEKVIQELQTQAHAATTRCGTLEKTLESSKEIQHRVKSLEIFNIELESQISKLKYDLEAKHKLLTSLRSEYDSLAATKDNLYTGTNSKEAESISCKVKELEDTIASMEIGKALAIEQSRKQRSELTEQYAKAITKAQSTEADLKREIYELERKLEAVRTVAEEASSVSQEIIDFKTIRHIETLQSQYTIATENWKGIESSLLARIAVLEQERDEAEKRQAGMRKKSRDAAAKYQIQEEEMAQLQAKIMLLENKTDELINIERLNSQVEQLKVESVEKDKLITQLKSDLDSKTNTWQSVATRTENDGWNDSTEETQFSGISTAPLIRPSSPQSYHSRNFSTEMLSNPRNRKTSTSGILNSDYDRLLSKWTHSQVSLRAPTLVSTRSGYMSLGIDSPVDHPLSPLAGFGAVSDVFEDLERPGSPQKHINDMVSVSTIAAGPSIQLVDRLSSTVRRLEAEKVAAKEEMARIAKQRDDARVEISALLKSSEESQSARTHITELETQIADITRRYQTALEMLGEKSEEVEELMADIHDVKAMYRDLVESTVGK